jgi:hypothetical protein
VAAPETVQRASHEVHQAVRLSRSPIRMQFGVTSSFLFELLLIRDGTCAIRGPGVRTHEQTLCPSTRMFKSAAGSSLCLNRRSEFGTGRFELGQRGGLEHQLEVEDAQVE